MICVIDKRGDTLVEWLVKIFNIMTHDFRGKQEGDGHGGALMETLKMKIIDIMTNKPSMVTDVIVINRVSIGSAHRMVVGSVTINTRAERRKLLNKNTQTRVDTQMIGTKKNTFQLILKNRLTALE